MRHATELDEPRGICYNSLMTAEQIIEHLKLLPMVERRVVLQFLESDLKESSEDQQAEDRKEIQRLRGVFGQKPSTGER